MDSNDCTTIAQPVQSPRQIVARGPVVVIPAPDPTAIDIDPTSGEWYSVMYPWISSLSRERVRDRIREQREQELSHLRHCPEDAGLSTAGGAA